MYVMQGKMKAIKVRKGMFGSGKWELYDVLKDPSERNNLAKKMPKKLNELKNIYNTYAAKHNIVDVKEDWNPFKAISGDLDSNHQAH